MKEEEGGEGRGGQAEEERGERHGPAVARRCSLCLPLILSLLLCAAWQQSFWGRGAGRQSVMSCQQCSDGSLTYFRKYHRIAIYNRAEQHGSSHVPGGLEHIFQTEMFLHHTLAPVC